MLPHDLRCWTTVFSDKLINISDVDYHTSARNAGGLEMAMDKCKDMAEVKHIAQMKGLVPGRVRDTQDGIQFTKGNNDRLVVISWEEFEEYLKKRNLAIYRSNGWLKIMKA